MYGYGQVQLSVAKRNVSVREVAISWVMTADTVEMSNRVASKAVTRRGISSKASMGFYLDKKTLIH